MNYNRDVQAESVTQERADEIGKEFLKSRGFDDMKETYYLKQDGIVTINYAYEQDGVTVYPDLIKLKVALDNGEIMGIETTGYLNSHEKRNISDIKITIEQAKKNLNSKLDILSENLAIIPTILELVNRILLKKDQEKPQKTFTKTISGVKAAIQRGILALGNLPDKAYFSLNACVKTLKRVFSTKKHLLEWMTAEDAEKNAKKDPDWFDFAED
jgi:hypothetical protein